MKPTGKQYLADCQQCRPVSGVGQPILASDLHGIIHSTVSKQFSLFQAIQPVNLCLKASEESRYEDVEISYRLDDIPNTKIIGLRYSISLEQNTFES